jgi:hypothetical protein
MGNRANLVIVESGHRQLYYSHWAGCRMLDALACGPSWRGATSNFSGPVSKTSGRIRSGLTAVWSSISIKVGCCSSARSSWHPCRSAVP